MIFEKDKTKAVKAWIPFIITGIVNVLCIYCINHFILLEEQERYTLTIDIWNRIQDYQILFTKSFLHSFNYIIPYANVIVIILTITICVIKKIEKEKIYRYIIFIIISIIMSSYYILLTKSGAFLAPRMCMSMGAIIGFSFAMILEIANVKIEKSSIIMYAIILLSFIYNAYTYVVLSGNHIQANKIYLEIGKTIEQKVEKYEKTTGKNVKYYYIMQRKQNSIYPKGILEVGSLTENPLTQNFCAKEFISIFAKKEVENYADTELYKSNGIQAFSREIIEKEYETFNEEQVEVNNGIIYICL